VMQCRVLNFYTLYVAMLPVPPMRVFVTSHVTAIRYLSSKSVVHDHPQLFKTLCAFMGPEV
jgi:hypothetical protein